MTIRVCGKRSKPARSSGRSPAETGGRRSVLPFGAALLPLAGRTMLSSADERYLLTVFGLFVLWQTLGPILAAVLARWMTRGLKVSPEELTTLVKVLLSKWRGFK